MNRPPYITRNFFTLLNSHICGFFFGKVFAFLSSSFKGKKSLLFYFSINRVVFTHHAIAILTCHECAPKPYICVAFFFEIHFELKWITVFVHEKRANNNSNDDALQETSGPTWPMRALDQFPNNCMSQLCKFFFEFLIF